MLLSAIYRLIMYLLRLGSAASPCGRTPGRDANRSGLRPLTGGVAAPRLTGRTPSEALCIRVYSRDPRARPPSVAGNRIVYDMSFAHQL